MLSPLPNAPPIEDPSVVTTQRPQKHRQPFRGAYLPVPMADVLAGPMEEHGSSMLFRAMTLAWENLPAAERAHYLVQAESIDGAVEALRAIDVKRGRPPSGNEMAEARKKWQEARARFDEGLDALTPVEVQVLRLRLLNPTPLTYDEVAEKAGLASKQNAKQVDERATHKLQRWLIALLAGHG